MKRILALLIITSLFLFACSQEGPSTPNLAVPFIGGNDGIEMGLIDGMPPAAVYDGSRMGFGIGVVLDNQGETDVGLNTDNPFVRVSLEGFPPALFGLDSTSDTYEDLEGTLLGAKKNFDGTVLPGQISRVLFPELKYSEPLEGNYVQNFLINLCYDYENIATVPICFKDDIIENVQDASICTLTGEKLPQNSGGPIHVTSVVQNPLAPHKVMVNMVIEHVGTGDFYGRSRTGGRERPIDIPGSDTLDDDTETCDPSITNLNKYRAYIELSSSASSNMDIDCGTLDQPAEGWITLYQGAPTTLTCTLSGDEDLSTRIYTDLLTVKLQYRYGESVVQPVVIQSVGSRGQ